MVKELAEACTNKNPSTVNFPNELVKTISMYTQLIEENESLLIKRKRK